MAKADKTDKAERKRAAPDKPLSFRDRNRALWEAVDLNRRFVEDLDKSVRYAMVIFGTLNAALLILVMQTPLLRKAAATVRGVLLVLGILYAVASIGVLTQSIRSLVPRLRGSELFPTIAPGTMPDQLGQGPHRLLYWEEILKQGLSSYQRTWRETRGEQLNDELSEILYGLAALVRVKYASLRRLYLGLVA